MLKLLDMFFLGATTGLSLFPNQVTDYEKAINELKEKIQAGMQADAENLCHDKSNLDRDLSTAYHQLVYESEKK